MARYKTFLIAGPTASGKSGLALELAAKFGGVIVNTDSMQVYRDLRIITARPSVEDEAHAPHRLYGQIDVAENWSTGTWLRSVETLLPQLRSEFQTVIFVGGTGLYFNSLTLGLSETPEIPVEIRQKLRSELKELGSKHVYAQLQFEDAKSAAALEPADGQRIIRALEVLRATGRPLWAWQEVKSEALIDLDAASTIALVLEPDREMLAAKISERFSAMVKEGALEEVSQLIKRNLDPHLPAMKAIGIADLRLHLTGQTSLDEAVNLAVIASRQYAKRQRTWFRGQMDERWKRFASAAAASLSI